MFDMKYATAELFAALAKAQAEMANACKNASNPHYKSRYADLAEVLNTIRQPLSLNGLAMLQTPSFDGAMAHVTTALTHTGGGYITATSSCKPAKSDAQGIGSATTYLRRYSAAAIAGIAQEDDDGQSARHDDGPTEVTAQQQAKADGFRDAIAHAGDDAALGKVGGELSGCGLPPSLMSDLRALYGERQKSIREAA